ncbi:M20/M25/M40 family metallo-hydrolase [Streptomyces polyrhachis]|uniref:M20/M25/M40 family metallo-hydrolase n=1 Tax=Streptomyces polyrhachis TaxID=1282885 RepID=A0ABW2GEJ4_9ACTN
MSSRRLTAALTAVALATPLLVASAGTATAASPGKDGQRLAAKLVNESTAKNAYKHLLKFQQIADANGGTRAAGTPGHDASAKYVYDFMKKHGYDVSYDEFEFWTSTTKHESLSVVSPDPRDLAVSALTFSKSTPVGGLVAPIAVAPVDADGTHGCEESDFAPGAFTGKIALVKRGACTFLLKSQNAAKAGAAAVIVYNHSPGPLNGTLGDATAVSIPSGGITLDEGNALAAAAAQGEVTVNLDLQVDVVRSTTRNVIAETKGGDADNVVMLGSHLDSVAQGPGINDNGSGSAGLLEVARTLADNESKPRNKVRFAWWSAEELGLVGSEDWVATRTEAELAQIELYLNFDMIASPNYVLGVYDGDNSDGVGAEAGPEGSAQLERRITDFMDRAGYPHVGTDFTGRSDYGPFIAVGIPAGGTFTGAEGIKTESDAALFGGTAGAPYDACYHQACDDINNISMKAFDANIDLIADSVGTYTHDLSSVHAPVVSTPTTGGNSGGGLHDDHHEPAL